MTDITLSLNPIQPQRLFRLLQRMIDIYSPSGKEEELLAYLYNFFKKRHLPVHRQMLEDGRYNVIVAPPDVDIELALIGHVDTVAAHDLEEMFEHPEAQNQPGSKRRGRSGRGERRI